MIKYMKRTGAHIYLSWDEYQALSSAICEIATNCEAADDEYVEGSKKDLNLLNNIVKKFKRAKYKKDNK